MRADSFVMNMANMGCMGMCRMEGMLNKVRMKTAVRRYGGCFFVHLIVSQKGAIHDSL